MSIYCSFWNEKTVQNNKHENLYIWLKNMCITKLLKIWLQTLNLKKNHVGLPYIYPSMSAISWNNFGNHVSIGFLIALIWQPRFLSLQYTFPILFLKFQFFEKSKVTQSKLGKYYGWANSKLLNGKNFQ